MWHLLHPSDAPPAPDALAGPAPRPSSGLSSVGADRARPGIVHRLDRNTTGSLPRTPRVVWHLLCPCRPPQPTPVSVACQAGPCPLGTHAVACTSALAASRISLYPGLPVIQAPCRPHPGLWEPGCARVSARRRQAHATRRMGFDMQSAHATRRFRAALPSRTLA